MTVDSTDIKFACSQCGQRILVERSAAGHTADCPACSHPFTVPDHSVLEETEQNSVLNSRGVEEPSDLQTARQEVARLQALFKKAVDECERLTASATHAQAELRSFQSERLQLKSELSQAKQRSLNAEQQMAELAAALGEKDGENAAWQEQMQNELHLTRERLTATEAQLSAREQVIHEMAAENTSIVQSVAEAQNQISAWQNEAANLQSQLSEAQGLLADAEQAARQHEETTQQFQALQSEHQSTLEARRQLEIERDGLRQDLIGTGTGQELLELRSKVQKLDAETQSQAAALAEEKAASRTATEFGEKLRQELDEVKRLREEAEKRAHENSESKLLVDNQVLRGIIARQNTTLGVHHAELRRLRRGRFFLRILYTLFAISLLALGALAFKILAPVEFAKILSF